MNLDEILHGAGRHKLRRRVGRGTGSGHGKRCGRGQKGMGARAGARQRLNYEGGQNPVLARIPKRGFSNAYFRKEVQTINVSDLEQFPDGARVDAAALKQARLIDNVGTPVKVLGDGQITKKLTVVATNFSESAAQKIAQAGGTVERQ